MSNGNGRQGVFIGGSGGNIQISFKHSASGIYGYTAVFHFAAVGRHYSSQKAADKNKDQQAGKQSSAPLSCLQGKEFLFHKAVHPFFLLCKTPNSVKKKELFFTLLG
ncbi:MAG: hypothetical protein Q4E38_08120 [Eubacteriales bacterium]|nr:hypothetical protein [Eubacteriales bacterium]